MKKSLICTALSASLLCSSCIGSFGAFHRVLDWNQEVSDDPYANQLIFVALWILPVYELSFAADVLVFNAIEFWRGDNPIALKDGDFQERIVSRKGTTYKLVATNKSIDIEAIEGKKKGHQAHLEYNATEKTWYLQQADGTLQPLSSWRKGLFVAYMPTGENLLFPQTQTPQQIQQRIDNYIAEEACEWAAL